MRLIPIASPARALVIIPALILIARCVHVLAVPAMVQGASPLWIVIAIGTPLCVAVGSVAAFVIGFATVPLLVLISSWIHGPISPGGWSSALPGRSHFFLILPIPTAAGVPSRGS